ncbi:MAG: AAA family ATPase [Planctomycetota bacterium]
MQHHQKTVDPELIEFLGEERVSRFAQTPQDKIHHGEGDVLIHVGMMLDVCDELCQTLKFTPEEHRLIRRSIFLHDYAKPECTLEEDGRIKSPHHSTRGEKLVRQWLYERNHPPQEREWLCALVRYHQHPTRVFTEVEPEMALIRLALSVNMPCKYLYALAYCDLKGRYCPDQAELLTNIELFAELAREYHCFDQPFDLSKHFQGTLSEALKYELTHYFCEPSYSLNLSWKYRTPQSFPSYYGDFVMMCGFPGVGKTTYIQNHFLDSDTKIISLDELREEWEILPEREKKGDMYSAAKEIAKAYFRNHRKRVVLDATSLSKDIRNFWIKLARDYQYRTTILLLERPWSQILYNNQNRSKPVPSKVMDRMFSIFDFPSPREVPQITWERLS